MTALPAPAVPAPVVPAPALHAYEYALLRVVPRVERGECLNAGVVLHCHALEHLSAVVSLDRARLHALDPGADAEAVEHALAAVVAVCLGHGAAGREPRGGRFRWLTAPRSTVVQPGPVHTGLTTDPAGDAVRLLARLVHPPG
ncbi:DUF3037 domain-containing protein [Rhodococcus antarcticus]|uniref:DUF3037 domain-containing protein n=1 Tax=Rhodococcus antarcticus TaxID=2987751 RepID=A0ABY6NXS4_9NOCA|nr:DUF3037 domain-containing protein [Rhodococcus antarcticus]UZJ24202.1 DUF3037 domain-containing protein [Rhodococcus antarcticus]